MANPRKQMIMNEISFWKQNKLLPEHYCDFLMTLYSEGDVTELDEKLAAKQSIKAQEKRFKWGYVAVPLVGFVWMIALLMMNPPLTLILIGFLVGIVCVIGAFYFLKRKPILAPLLQLSAALILLGSSIQLCAKYFEGVDMALYIVLIANCLLWFISGLLMRLPYFSIAGGLGLLGVIVYGVI